MRLVLRVVGVALMILMIVVSTVQLMSPASTPVAQHLHAKAGAKLPGSRLPAVLASATVDPRGAMPIVRTVGADLRPSLLRFPVPAVRPSARLTADPLVS